MKAFNIFINNLIPDRFRVTYELNTKVRGAIISQIVIGTILTSVGLLLWYFEKKSLELYLNTGVGVFILLSIFSLKVFKSFESYINIVLSAGYLVLFAFILLTGGLYSDASFWLALLVSINITYTKPKHSFFWISVVILFMGALFYAQSSGLDFNFEAASYAKKGATFISFFTLLIIVTYSYSKINNTKNSYHLEIISRHKRLLKERDDLMSIIAHDMKSPLRRIEGLIGVFNTENLTKEQKEVLKRLDSTALESKQLIDDLLEAKSFNSNLTIENVNINELVSDLKNGFLPLSNKKNIRIITRGLRSKIYLETSSYELNRILDNLLSNAIKFSPFDTRIEIICAQNEKFTSISFQDHGPGFNADDETKMFQMFQKLTARPTGGESSTGLGLSIIKNLTSLLKGELKYVTKPGKGTTFTLMLPNKFPSNNQS
ncbi:MAG: HAMP domain-containing histidine kinase [Cyclobacteriaceae bacterium]|nr:HAMP domain-containing histidine kinase [Cyclobacteriaceae bacterium]